jgi:hypothetical protein
VLGRKVARQNEKESEQAFTAPRLPSVHLCPPSGEFLEIVLTVGIPDLRLLLWQVSPYEPTKGLWTNVASENKWKERHE